MTAPDRPPDAAALLAAVSSIPGIADLLPRSVRELAAEVGLPVALRLVAACGGTTVYVPRKAGPNHPLAARIGAAGLAALAAGRGGEPLDVPRCAAARRAVVRRRIAEQSAGGVPAAELAVRWGYSRSHIHRILRSPQNPPEPTRCGGGPSIPSAPPAVTG